ncbi:S-layer homology domain-containing protein [Selenomonas ruminantium]|uniref:S-layer homology domain-containing protein n=1 Tax=Selenomonas ruminantium TaxID=971 RepID=A0A1M6USX5_SELRU|nr:putative porin [Selenomonas ruminantium]SHK72302.1 S-layer homology domain-containing protein [Selenomonas ruminantium]
MKKTLVSALTAALVVGAASTTFAASNPFSDVPEGHWAYESIQKLVDDNVIDGYGDGTFRGDRTITRYEAAQMVAKAMAKNPTGEDKTVVDKLRAEFADELNNLGVRVSDLERNADKVKWNGEARFTYTSDRNKNTAVGTNTKVNSAPLLFRLEPSAEVNDHWHVKARLDATTHLNTDAANNNSDRVKLVRAWAQGDYDKFQVKLGKFGSLNGDSIADTQFSGAEVSFGKEVKGIVAAGRLSTNVYGGNYAKAANYQYLGVEGAVDRLSGGLYLHRLNTKSLSAAGTRTAKFFKNNTEDTSNIIAVKGSYKIGNNVKLNGFYSNNPEADNYKQAASAEVSYKGAQKANQGTWGAWVAYRHLGSAAMVKSTYDVIKPDFKGWEIGANYAPFKNVVATARYGDAKEISNSNQKEKILFGRVQFFF